MKTSKKNRIVSLAVCLVLLISAVAGMTVSASAADLPNIDYNYATTATTGTINYISQNDGRTNRSPRSSYFNDAYWGSWVNGGNNSAGPGSECGTASISMALSYVGVYQTPGDILSAHNGTTCFDGWGPELQYPSLSEAMDRLESGNGKYSPAIIHFYAGAPGYSYGHYVLVIGHSGNTYTILDCNKDNTWTLSESDTLYGCIDTVMQYYNSSAVIASSQVAAVQASKPDSVKPTNLTLTVTKKNGAVVRSSNSGKADILGRKAKGTELHAVGYTDSGKLWYYLDDGSYIYGKNVKVTAYLSDASISGVDAPNGTISFGNYYILKGVISGNRATSVTVNVRDASGNAVLTATDQMNGSYSLQSSSIDKAITFNTLSRGSYTYEIVVREDVDTGTTCAFSDMVLYSSSFTVA